MTIVLVWPPCVVERAGANLTACRSGWRMEWRTIYQSPHNEHTHENYCLPNLKLYAFFLIFLHHENITFTCGFIRSQPTLQKFCVLS